MKEKRVKSYWISEDTMIQILRGEVKIAMDYLPPDVIFTGIREEVSSSGFLVFASSDTFHRISLGACVPHSILTFHTVDE